MRVSVEESVALLDGGDVVAIPTDTVYGLAASYHNSEAIQKIFTLKGRSKANPLIILVPSLESVFSLVKEVPQDFEKLVAEFWPGALTMVLPANEEKVSEEIRAGLPTVGFRHPAHPLTQQLLQIHGPVVAPSANLSGRPSATCPQHVEHDFGDDFPVLDGGTCQKGIESTIIGVQEKHWKVIRKGAITLSQLEDVLGYPVKESTATLPATSLTIPRARLHLSKESYDGSIKAVLGFEERQYSGAEIVITLGSLKDEKSMMQRLHPALRELDERGITDVWVDMSFPRKGILVVIAERLEAIGLHQRKLCLWGFSEPA